MAARPPRPPRPLKLAPLLTLTGETDAHGRLLLEDSAPDPARRLAERAGVAMTSRTWTNPESPSRQDGTYNVAAYEAIRADLGPMLAGLAWLAQNYTALDPSRRSTARSLYDVSYLAMHLPLVLLHRAEDPVPAGELPPYVAAMFKASRGIFSASVNLLNRSPADATITGAEAVAFAEEHGHLRRRQTGRVCAAPNRLIARTLDVMLTGEGADPAHCDIAELVSFDVLWRFHVTHEELNTALNDYRVVLERAMAEGGTMGPDPRTLFATRIDIGGSPTTLGSHTQKVLARVGQLQEELNAILGRRGRTPGVTFEELTQLL